MIGGLPGLPRLQNISAPMQAVGGLFAMSADAVRFMFKRPFQGRELLDQCWFIARVALAPTLLVAIAFTVLISFTLNILLRELGAADLSGAVQPLARSPKSVPCMGTRCAHRS